MKLYNLRKCQMEKAQLSTKPVSKHGKPLFRLMNSPRRERWSAVLNDQAPRQAIVLTDEFRR